MSGVDQIVVQLTRIADGLERRNVLLEENNALAREATENDRLRTALLERELTVPEAFAREVKSRAGEDLVSCHECGRQGPSSEFDLDPDDGAYLCKEGGECDQRAAARRKTRGDLVHAPQSIRPLIEAAERFAQLARAFGDARPEENAAACAAAVDAEEALRLAARRLLDPDAAFVYAPTKPAPSAPPAPGDDVPL